jgi:hypothetical protein
VQQHLACAAIACAALLFQPPLLSWLQLALQTPCAHHVLPHIICRPPSPLLLLLLPQVVFSNHETKDPGPDPGSETEAEDEAEDSPVPMESVMGTAEVRNTQACGTMVRQSQAVQAVCMRSCVCQHVGVCAGEGSVVRCNKGQQQSGLHHVLDP